MAFSVRVNGEVVKEFAEQVIGVHLRTARGEASALGVSDVGAVDLVVDVVNAGDPQRLDVVEALARKTRRDALTDGMITGPAILTSDRSLAVVQDLSDLEAEQPVPPAIDLATGLDPFDPNYGQIIDERAHDFASSGDAHEAVESNPPTGLNPHEETSGENTGGQQYDVSGTVEAQPTDTEGIQL